MLFGRVGMAKAKGGKNPTPSGPWPADLEMQVELVRKAAAGDAVARQGVRWYLYENIGAVVCPRLQAKGFPCDEEAKGAIRDLMFDWLDGEHGRGKQKKRTGWEILGDYQGRRGAGLLTFLRRWALGWADEYCRREVQRRARTTSLDSDEIGGLSVGSGLDSWFSGGEVEGGQDEATPPPPDTWGDDEIRAVQAASDDPVHRLAFYLRDLANRLPPPEEVARAADALRQGRKELGKRITDLYQKLVEEVLKRDADESREEESLVNKRIRLRELRAKKARGNKLRDNEVSALQNLPEEISRIEAKLETTRRRWKANPVKSSLSQIKAVLYPEEGAGVDRTTIGSWIKTMEKKMEEKPGSRGGGSPASRVGHHSRGVSATGQQSPPPPRPSHRRSS